MRRSASPAWTSACRPRRRQADRPRGSRAKREHRCREAEREPAAFTASWTATGSTRARRSPMASCGDHGVIELRRDRASSDGDTTMGSSLDVERLVVRRSRSPAVRSPAVLPLGFGEPWLNRCGFQPRRERPAGSRSASRHRCSRSAAGPRGRSACRAPEVARLKSTPAKRCGAMILVRARFRPR